MPPSHVLAERTAVILRVPPYRPGEFYRRELPPLRAILDDLTGLGPLVVDGYADLDPAGRPGLGAHAHAEFGIPVIGVAKSQFRAATHAVPVVRGSSGRPLFITAAGRRALSGMPRCSANAGLATTCVGAPRSVWVHSYGSVQSAISPGPVREQVVVCGTGDRVAVDIRAGQHATGRRGQAGLLHCRSGPQDDARSHVRGPRRSGIGPRRRHRPLASARRPLILAHSRRRQRIRHEQGCDVPGCPPFTGERGTARCGLPGRGGVSLCGQLAWGTAGKRDDPVPAWPFVQRAGRVAGRRCESLLPRPGPDSAGAPGTWCSRPAPAP
jgi:hypothetical protein